MKQQGVLKSDVAFIIKECRALLDKAVITPKAAFEKRLGEIDGLSVSGRTLRRMFDGEHIHVNTIKKIIKNDLKKKISLVNGIIHIDHEANNTSS